MVYGSRRGTRLHGALLPQLGYHRVNTRPTVYDQPKRMEQAMIRTVQPSDASAIASICETAMRYETSAELIERRISELADDAGYLIAVFEDDETGEVQAFMQAERYRLVYGSDGWDLIVLGVKPEHQGRGIGKQMLAAFEEHARQDGASFVRLNSRVERTKAHGFYEHLGYTHKKTQKYFFKQL